MKLGHCQDSKNTVNKLTSIIIYTNGSTLGQSPAHSASDRGTELTERQEKARPKTPIKDTACFFISH